MTAVTERRLIERLAAGLPRSPHQLNALHESDAELVRLPGTDLVLAITTDVIAEEIATGLYRDPYLAGWMIVTVNASDLAAVGATPVGIVLSESLPPTLSDDALDALQRGIRDAAAAHDLPVLGGDTNSAPALSLGGTALGTVPADKTLTRVGARPGDRLFASGPLGLGTAFAFQALMHDEHGATAVPFRPVSRLREGHALGGLASACMDTSDGVIATLDELMHLNGVGVRWELALTEALHPSCLATAQQAGLPLWTMLAGPHGEFELLFTVTADHRAALDRVTTQTGWTPIELGEVTADRQCWLCDGMDWLEFDTSRVRNLFGEVNGDPARYLQQLLGPAAPKIVGRASGAVAP